VDEHRHVEVAGREHRGDVFEVLANLIAGFAVVLVVGLNLD